MKKNDIILIGGGGHCKSCIDIIETEGIYTICGILDKKELIGQNVLGYPFLGTDSDLPEMVAEYPNFHISIGQIGNGEIRERLFEMIRNLGGNLPTIISPYARVSKHAQIGNGSIIMHGAIVNATAFIGNNSIINSRALIEHDAVIGSYTHIATAAVINGGTKVGSNCFVGSGSITKQGISIPDHTFIKANSLVK